MTQVSLQILNPLVVVHLWLLLVHIYFLTTFHWAFNHWWLFIYWLDHAFSCQGILASLTHNTSLTTFPATREYVPNAALLCVGVILQELDWLCPCLVLKSRVNLIRGHSTGHRGIVLHLIVKDLLLLVEVLDHLLLLLLGLFGDVSFLPLLRGGRFEAELTFLLLRIQETMRCRAAVAVHF